MASFFPSFRSSTMPKRLLRYALSRLELLDTEGLDMQNLDLALGRNTVLEFKDVGIRVKKLEKLLKLPATFRLEKAKVLLLRITIPIDFYTSPITVDVDGVDIRLNVIDPEKKTTHTPGSKTPDDTGVIPDTVDLAQSFLQAQPKSEREELEEALAAETHDLGASIAASDDDSEEELGMGTGQPLTLPTFLADFLQGIADRLKVSIKGVKFQLDLDVLVEPTATSPEPVSFQIALEGVNVEGVTTRTSGEGEGFTHKEGKRHISLEKVRAYLISEANVFSALARSPSVVSPSVASSPALTRNPPSRETSSLSQGSFHQQPMLDLQQSFRSEISDHDDPMSPHFPLGDSEEALSIPYDMSDPEEADDSPPTPRASSHPYFPSEIDESMFHSTMLPGEIQESPRSSGDSRDNTALSRTDMVQSAVEEVAPLWASVESQPFSEPMGSFDPPYNDLPLRTRTPEQAATSPVNDSPADSVQEDLAESHLYTAEEAKSMYMSAFSSADDSHAPGTSRIIRSQRFSDAQVLADDNSARDSSFDRQGEDGGQKMSPSTSGVLYVSYQQESGVVQHASQDAPETTISAAVQRPASPRAAMPGGWDDDISESSPELAADPRGTKTLAATPVQPESDSEDSSPAFSRANLKDEPPVMQENIQASRRSSNPDEAATPKGATRLVKEILNLDTVSIYVPSQQSHINVDALPPESVAQLSQSLGRSFFPQAPGAFSVHEGSSRGPGNRADVPDATTTEKEKDKTLEVKLSPLNINFDASLGFLLAMVAGKLLEAIKAETPAAGKPPSTPTPPNRAAESKSGLDISLVMEQISINFLNHLGGVADTSERYLDPDAFLFQREILLNATLQNLSAKILTAEALKPSSVKSKPHAVPTVSTQIELEKFRFGYAKGDIVSFDSSRPMSTSVRDTFLATGHDVGIKILQSDGAVRTSIETRPLVLQVDLQRLDETFSWFGGLSSFLNMSASITSSPPTVSKSVPLPPQKPRGVRFETPINPNDKSAASENKVNLRIGGALVELVGKDCSLAAESSAIKLVSRDEGIGIACTMMRMSGPYLRNSTAEPAITTEIGGVRLDFLSTPKDTDLERLLELITPSKAKFDNANDEIIVDTLLRQRRKGSVLRAFIETINVKVRNTAQLNVLPALGEEVAKLSTVAKYLPEDDRPGLLTLCQIQKVGASLDLGGNIGLLVADVKDLDIGHITVPSLVAVAVHQISLVRNEKEELINSSVYGGNSISIKGPVLMARMIGDEIEPVIKLKLQDIMIEYHVPTIMDILGLGEDATPQDFEAGLAASIADLGEQTHTALARQPPSPSAPSKPSKPLTLDIGFRDCVFGLNPLNLPSKLAIVLTDAHLKVVLPEETETKAEVHINKASVLLIDNVANLLEEDSRSSRQRSSGNASQQVAFMCSRGFVDISYISSAQVVVLVTPGPSDGEKQVNVDVRDDLLVFETCADSTQTLITLANALKPPTPPSKENKYRTNVVPVQDLLASISAEAFGRPEGEYDFDTDFAGAQELAGSGSDIGYASDSPLRVQSQFYDETPVGEEIFDATKGSVSSHGTSMVDTSEGVLLSNYDSQPQPPDSDDGEGLVIHENYYLQGAEESSSSKVWNSQKNTYDQAPSSLVKRSPLRINVRDVHFIWNLFDGYDWEATRDVISKAVHDVEARALERQTRLTGQRPQVYEEEIFEDEETIGDFLFSSIYIGVPASRDPHELSRAINEGLHDNATETESVVTTAYTGTTNRTARPHQPKSKRLRLHRSKRHKITFELKGVNMDFVAYPPDTGETQSSIDVRVDHLDVFDHVPTSTWKKFATYDQDMGAREMGTSMAHIEILNVKPNPELGAAEIVLRATVLPLRLHVDQDALDFITRFFEFKDEKVPVHSSPTDVPFLQRAEVNSVPVKLDFKPKRVDYAGLRSGHTSEFMNFITLEESRMVLRHVIIYGVSGFDRFGKTLNDIWSPDVRNNQLPGVVAGLAPVRSLVNIGSGFRDLVEIPIREYKKDGRVVRSISKGAVAFARNTGTELVKLGTKLAVGAQYALQGAETLLSDQATSSSSPHDAYASGEEDMDEEERKQISLYASQPTGVIQGIRGGYRSLVRDMNLARDAIIAVPGEVMESEGPGGAARAVWRRAPTIVFRPAVGVTRMVGQTLMGVTNIVDPEHRRRIEEKYKH